MRFEYAGRFEDFRTAVLEQRWAGFWRPRALATNVALQTGVALAMDEWGEFGSLAFVAYFVSCALLVSLAYTVVAGRLAARRQYRQIAVQQEQITLDVDAAALETTTPVLHVRLPWAGLTRWQETARTVLLYRADALCQIIPKRILTEGELASMRGFARAAGLAGTA